MHRITFHTSFLQDSQNRRYFTFLAVFSLMLFIFGIAFCTALMSSAKTILLSHDEAIVSSLLNQGIPAHAIATALSDMSVKDTQAASALLSRIGISKMQDSRFLPPLHEYARTAQTLMFSASFLLSSLLLFGTYLFLSRREGLYRQASSVLDDYLSGDYSRHLPQEKEGSLYRMFSCIDRLATMLQAQNENEHHAKIFLRNTISDISHQLKTPLAALSMYLEIMENEPGHPDVIQEFSAKSETSIRRMEQLIQSMLKITRLDTGNILFEKHKCKLEELVMKSLDDLADRARNEGKEIVTEGSPNDTLICDISWTSEAIGNLVKNALEHTKKGGTICISWHVSPIAVKIIVSDDGKGIAPEDIHHIFKRFYRSRKSQDTQGIGLGLSLAKSIVEGQDGTITVHSIPGEGTEFIVQF